jgi:hypothetical protein
VTTETPPPRNEKPSLYALLLPELRDIARQHGYALALHGSLLRDLDLVAIPWVAEPSAPEVLVQAVRDVLGPYAHFAADAPPSLMPHGRLAYSIRLTGEPADNYLDLSVMPRLGEPPFNYPVTPVGNIA